MLSLDAPIIAAIWQDLFAYDANVRLSVASRAALPLAVWLIYLGDRLLDTRDGLSPQRSARHTFYCAQRRLCWFLTILAGILLTVSTFYVPRSVMRNGLVVAASVVLYLMAVHFLSGKWRGLLPKELAVGFVFTAGTVLAPITRAGDGWCLVFPALLFSILCCANCSSIEVCENGTADSYSTWIVRHVKVITVGTALLCLPLSLWGPIHHVALALFLAALGIGSISGNKAGLPADAFRVWMDVPLLAPLVLLGLR